MNLAKIVSRTNTRKCCICPRTVKRDIHDLYCSDECSNRSRKYMAVTGADKYGYRITNNATGTTVSVGPFISRDAARHCLTRASGFNKRIILTNKFNFTPSWNGWLQYEYEGEDYLLKRTFPII